MNKVYLYGASGHAKVIIENLEEQNYTIEGLFDDNITIKSILDYPCFGALDLNKIADAKLIISIGNNLIRKNLSDQLDSKLFFTLADQSANISKRATIGIGTVIMKGASINSDVVIGKHAIINTNSSIDHDCKLGDFVHISPNAALSGNVEIGEGTHIGTGTAIIQDIKIGKWCTIGAGSTIINDIPDYSVVVGNPGKIIKKLKP